MFSWIRLLCIIKCLVYCRSAARGQRSSKSAVTAGNSTAVGCSEDDEEMNEKVYEYSCGDCSDVDCVEERGDRSPRGKSYPSPVASDDCCFDPCKKSSPRRDSRSPTDDRGGSGRGPRSPGSGRKPTRSASEICDECSSMNATPRSPSTRRRRDSCCDDMPRCRPQSRCPELPLDRTKAPYKRATSGDGGSERDSPVSERRTSSRSPSRGRATLERSEQRSGRSTPASRSQSRKRSASSRGDARSQDRHGDSSLERTTTRTRTGGPCCPDPEERNCETDSRFLIPLSCLSYKKLSYRRETARRSMFTHFDTIYKRDRQAEERTPHDSMASLLHA